MRKYIPNNKTSNKFVNSARFPPKIFIKNYILDVESKIHITRMERRVL